MLSPHFENLIFTAPTLDRSVEAGIEITENQRKSPSLLQFKIGVHPYICFFANRSMLDRIDEHTRYFHLALFLLL